MPGKCEDPSLIPRSTFGKRLDTGTFVYNLPAGEIKADGYLLLLDQPDSLISELQDSFGDPMSKEKRWTAPKK